MGGPPATKLSRVSVHRIGKPIGIIGAKRELRRLYPQVQMESTTGPYRLPVLSLAQMGAEQSQGSSRLPGLDGLRAISVAMVILFHLGSSEYFSRRRWFHAVADEGLFGVQIFFVISGFLISWLLFQEERRRIRIDLAKFYIRRALRILPPAIFFLLCLRLLAIPGLVAVTWRDVMYAILFVRNVMPGPVLTNHFWSLAIEEQFYLCWPLLLVIIPPGKRLTPLIALIIGVPVWRYLHLAEFFGLIPINYRRFDVACDGLLMGCLLAVLREDPYFSSVARCRILQSVWTPVAAALVCAAAIEQPFHATAISQGFLPLAKSAVIALIINYVVEGHRNWLDRILSLGPLTWLGRVSYSVYIWQQPFCDVQSLHWFNRFPANVLLSVGAGAASYYFLEQPLARVRARMKRGAGGSRNSGINRASNGDGSLATGKRHSELNSL